MTMIHTKLAWIREPGFPIGTPAPGHFDCDCGARIEAPTFGEGAGPYACSVCGLTVDGRGWVLIPGA